MSLSKRVFILDVERAIRDGVMSLGDGAGLFRGEFCEIVKQHEVEGNVWIRLPDSLNPEQLHCVHVSHLIKHKEKPNG